jgi:two-component system heavy metal sensor histidine kinase CusS
MLARLEEAFARLSSFSSDIAHELRTPVSNLMTQTQVALSRARSADDYRSILESNAEEFERLARMISDMLLLAKADNGWSAGLARFPLADEVWRCSSSTARWPRITASPLRLGPPMRGDRLMLRWAIGNLFQRPAPHAKGGTVTATVAPGLMNPPARVRLAIANTGEPIPAEHLPPFDCYQADAARRHGARARAAGDRSLDPAFTGT